MFITKFLQQTLWVRYDFICNMGFYVINEETEAQKGEFIGLDLSSWHGGGWSWVISENSPH